MSNRRFEVITKEVADIKLTVAKDRVTLKFPPNTSPEEREKYINYAKIIDSKIPSIEFTVRGRFHQKEPTHPVIQLIPKGVEARAAQKGFRFFYEDLNSIGNV